MRIGIIGSGKMGTALGKRWLRAGHEVFFGSRDAGKAAETARSLGGSAHGGSYADAVAFGDVLLLSVPWKATRDVLSSLSGLDGKILIECTNNLTGEAVDGGTTEKVAEWAPGAKVVKAFNTIFFALIDGDPAALRERPTVFVIGDDGAKPQVLPLVTDAGFEPVDGGGIGNAPYLDAMGAFLVHLGYGRGMGDRISYRLAHV